MKIDLHVHSSEISPCGHLTVREVTDLYSRAGYDAIVLTNHFNRTAARILEEKTGNVDFAGAFLETFHQAEQCGRECGLKVFCGYELRFDNSANDYLLYGLPDAMAYRWDEFCRMGIEEFSTIAAENGVLLYQAHPFRNGMDIIKPSLLFGMEVKNTHPRHDSRNDIALAWAEKYGLHRIAGSDCHQIQDVGTSGIRTEDNVENTAELVDMLKNDRYIIL